MKHNKIIIPASKSYLQRALAIGLLENGTTILRNVSWCDDSVAVKNIVSELGANIIEQEHQLIIQSSGLQINNNSFFVGESGLALRMFCPIIALSGKKVTISGNGSLNNRPVDFVAKTLKQVGVTATTNKGLPPITIQHKLSGGKFSIDGSISSQLLTGLLIALPLADSDSEILVDNLKSIPYINMTLDTIRHFGVQISHNNYKHFFIKGNQTYKPTEFTIEGDWSGAAFFLVAGALMGEIEITNLSVNSLQADRKILDVLQKTGAKISVNSNSVIVGKNNLKAFNFDATHCPDLFPPLVVLAANCKGTSTIKGVSRLIHKESNRAEVIKGELVKLGIRIQIQEDMMLIEGGEIKGGTIDSHNDHRIAMMGGILNLVASDEILIKNKETVNKSYPQFFNDLKMLFL